MTCAACASDVAPSASFCPSCGAPVHERSETPTGTAPRGTPSPARPTPPGSGVHRSSPGTSSAIAGQGRFAPGALLAERYRVVGLLGKGGMGEVYRADDLKLGQPVALKLLPPALARESERLERFYREVSIARQVSHPNVCRVYDVGEIAGEHYLSMEFVDGEDLASLLRRIGRLPGDKALEIARQLCAGLAAAHDKGVLHRDLKPENVMLDGRGKVRITDFGLASLAEQVAGGDVRSGTPAYMSPEQLTGREVSVRSDVYALGLVLYELFTGKRAFEGKGYVELLRKHENEAPRSPGQLVSDLDPGVESVILRCLEKDPQRRPASALAVAAALPGGDPLAAALAAGETPSPEMVAAAGQGEGLRPRTAWALAAFALLGVLAFVAGVSPYAVLGTVPFEKPPLVLADRARELIAAAGYAEAPGDTASGYYVDSDYIVWQSARDKTSARWRSLRAGDTPVIQLWYRQSPQPLVSSAISGRVFWLNPPALFPGMTGARLDMRGHLVEFYAVPPQLEEAGAPAGAADWARLFAEARLDIARFEPVAPKWTPRTYGDSRLAWEGAFPGHADLKLRVEAASYRGWPVWFHVIHPWTRATKVGTYGPTTGQLVAWTVVSLFLLCSAVAGGLLARRNLRLGRVDRRGAASVASFSLAIGMAKWALEADHLSEFNRELNLLARGLAAALLNASLTGLLYLALEPYVRRLWPHALISWTRLLSGRWRDPLVGAHVLMGVVYAVGLMLTMVLSRALLLTAGDPPAFPPTFSLDALLGPHQTLMFQLDRLVDSVTAGMGMVLLFVGLRFLFKRPWLAAVVAATIIGLPDAFSSGTTPWIAVPVAAVLMGFYLAALVREGLLSLAVTLFVVGLVANMPLSFEFSQWYGMPTKVALALFVALAAYGLRTALAGSERRTLAPDMAQRM